MTDAKSKTILSLLEKALAGNRPAFDSFFREVSPAMFRAGLSVVWNRDIAEDAIQNVFRDLAKSPKPLLDSNNPIATLCRMTELRCKKISGHEARQNEIKNRLLLAKGKTAEKNLSTEMLAGIESAIASLNSEERGILVAHLYGEKTFLDISEETGMSLGAVQSAYYRALDQIREKLHGIA